MGLAFFTDPVLRSPTLGTMLMGLAAGLIGCLVFLQKRSLVGEALSHAAYPGVVLSVLFAALFLPFSEKGASVMIMSGAFLSALLGQWVIHQLQKKVHISSDAALCFVLSIFFGVGVLVASYLQLNYALWYRQIQVFLFGQAATMMDGHVVIYAALAGIVILALSVLYRNLEILYFDPSFAQTVGMPTKFINGVVHLLLVLAIVVGMRSVGVVLMSAMLIAPAAGARQWTNHLFSFFILSALFGLTSGFFGNALSIWIPQWIGQPRLALPTGPMIVLTATALCLFSLFFAPKNGYITRQMRKARFKWRCAQENVLKALYKGKEVKASGATFFLMRLRGWVQGRSLTPLGFQEGAKLVRLHRLWEVYLVHMGQGVERVHHNAEEMEHILTPEIEMQLQTLLDHPEMDPHKQPIPQKEDA